MNISHLKRYGALYAKNSLGKRTSRKIVAFSVDDYGVQRTASIEARTAMERTGMDLHTNRFDWYDSLETEADLTALWETLDSVRDCNGAPAIFTAFACPANMDYDMLVDSGGTQYGIILLPDLYRKTESGNAMELWRQGIASKLVNVQYHGREHVNLRTLRKLLQDNDAQVWCNIKNGSWAGISRRISYNRQNEMRRSSEPDAIFGGQTYPKTKCYKNLTHKGHRGAIAAPLWLYSSVESRVFFDLWYSAFDSHLNTIQTPF